MKAKRNPQKSPRFTRRAFLQKSLQAATGCFVGMSACTRAPSSIVDADAGPSKISLDEASPWRVHKIGLAGNIEWKHLHFISEKVGWIHGEVAGKHFLLQTEDGGINWRPKQTTIPYEQVHFINRLVGWCLCRGTLNFSDSVKFFHTVDGGLTWQPKLGKIVQFSPFGSDLLRDGGFGSITGGSHLKDRFADFPKMDTNILLNTLCPTQIYFHPENTQAGFLLFSGSAQFEGAPCACAFSLLLQTQDGGDTLDARILPQENPCGNPFRDLCFVNEKEGWLGGDAGIFHTLSGGERWEKEWAFPPINHPGGIFSVRFVTSQEGWISGTFGGGFPFLRRTMDGGKTWEAQTLKDGTEFGGVLAMKSPFEGWIAGEKIYSTCDGGRNWEVEWFPEESSLLNAPSFVTHLKYIEATNSVWAMGTAGMLLERG